jgi:hypothetical protein
VARQQSFRLRVGRSGGHCRIMHDPASRHPPCRSSPLPDLGQAARTIM